MYTGVFWDNRIPHANSYKNVGEEARIVVYCSFLPDIEINRFYAKKQLEDYKMGRIPRDQWIDKDEVENGGETGTNEERIDRNYRFSKLGRKLMMIDEW